MKDRIIDFLGSTSSLLLSVRPKPEQPWRNQGPLTSAATQSEGLGRLGNHVRGRQKFQRGRTCSGESG